MPEPLLLIVGCKQCGLWIQTDDGTHPNAPGLLRCACCTEEHDHDTWEDEGRAAPCRPVDITLISPVALQLGQGQPQSSVFSDGMTVPGSDPEALRQPVIQGQIHWEE